MHTFLLTLPFKSRKYCYFKKAFGPAFREKGGAWAKIEVYFARYPKRGRKKDLVTYSLVRGKLGHASVNCTVAVLAHFL
jgi:hypothetical protein